MSQDPDKIEEDRMRPNKGSNIQITKKELQEPNHKERKHRACTICTISFFKRKSRHKRRPGKTRSLIKHTPRCNWANSGGKDCPVNLSVLVLNLDTVKIIQFLKIDKKWPKREERKDSEKPFNPPLYTSK